ncbi:Pre-rRNA-processing protein ipi3 [Cyanidiococcus yangmingshanensis]|uniref:Pre-rRNA-processing protein ipi3 n=1 Tax=Cyanidiococcus yangmingshanensis TaxID=2690220 RepID=A0A7J7IIG9_9RHOD|nr:Pre-rRNA-processing protein ipi3 [Cyanidiococcus yangmingshanensis]
MANRSGSDVLSVSVTDDGSTARALIWNTQERVVLREVSLSRTKRSQQKPTPDVVSSAVSAAGRLGVPPVCVHSIAWDRHVIAQNIGPAKSIVTYCTLERETENAHLSLEENVTALVCSYGGRWLAVGTQRGLGYLWDLLNGALLVPRQRDEFDARPEASSPPFRDAPAWQIQPLAVTVLQFTPDDQFLVAGGEDGSVSIWALHELFTGNTHRPFRRYPDIHAGRVLALRLGASWQLPLTRLYSIGRDRTLRIHDLGTGMLLATIHLSAPPTCLVVDDALERVVYVGHETGEILRIYLPSFVIDSSRASIVSRAFEKTQRTSDSASASTCWIRAYTESDAPERRGVRALSFAEGGALLLYGNESGAVGLIHLHSFTIMAEFRGAKAHGNDAVLFVASISPPTGAVPASLWQPAAYALEKKRQRQLAHTTPRKQTTLQFSKVPAMNWDSFELVDHVGVRPHGTISAAHSHDSAHVDGADAPVAADTSRKGSRQYFLELLSIMNDES